MFGLNDKVRVFVPHLGYREGRVKQVAGAMLLVRWGEDPSEVDWYIDRTVTKL